MNITIRKNAAFNSHLSLLVVAIGIGGCLQTAPVVVVTPADQAARLLYNCPNGKTLDVTRVQNGASALLVVDGKTLQLPRDSAVSSGERYTNRLQTLTLFGSGATYQNLGQTAYGPCTASAATVAPLPPDPAGERDRQNLPRREGSS